MGGRQLTVLFAIPAIILLIWFSSIYCVALCTSHHGYPSHVTYGGRLESCARAPVTRADETVVARGLNQMLALAALRKIRRHAWTKRLGAETDERELVESYQACLLREALTQAEHWRRSARWRLMSRIDRTRSTSCRVTSSYDRGDPRRRQARPPPPDNRGPDSKARRCVRACSTTRGVRAFNARGGRRPGRAGLRAFETVAAGSECRGSRRCARRPLPPISADPVQLELALLNLVNNSSDAMPSGAA